MALRCRAQLQLFEAVTRRTRILMAVPFIEHYHRTAVWMEELCSNEMIQRSVCSCWAVSQGTTLRLYSVTLWHPPGLAAVQKSEGAPEITQAPSI